MSIAVKRRPLPYKNRRVNMRKAITTSIVLITFGSSAFAGEQVTRSSGHSSTLEIVAVVISLLSLCGAIISSIISWHFKASSQLEAWTLKVYVAIKDCLPSNDIPGKAGLSVARLLDSMPKNLKKKRKDIVMQGYSRAVPAGSSDAFWKHLCEIQGWNNGTST